jgi:DNA-directed RNA polymerase subunit M
MPVRFCPRDGALLIPQRRGDVILLRCPRCGYEVKSTERLREGYRQKSGVFEDKRRGVIIAKEERVEIDQEQREELRRQLLENLQETDREGE